ncbi:MAG: DUF3052 family protein [Solirubrobacterales bacterium]
MAEKDYSHRSVVDKLGLHQGMRVRMTGDVGAELKTAAKARIGGSLLRSGDLDVIVRAVRTVEEADEFVERVRPQLHDDAVLWLVTRKKGDPRYIKQEDLIPVGKAHELVDNKICSIDETRSAMRFVIPKHLR